MPEATKPEVKKPVEKPVSGLKTLQADKMSDIKNLLRLYTQFTIELAKDTGESQTHLDPEFVNIMKSRVVAPLMEKYKSDKDMHRALKGFDTLVSKNVTPADQDFDNWVGRLSDAGPGVSGDQAMKAMLTTGNEVLELLNWYPAVAFKYAPSKAYELMSGKQVMSDQEEKALLSGPIGRAKDFIAGNDMVDTPSGYEIAGRGGATGLSKAALGTLMELGPTPTLGLTKSVGRLAARKGAYALAKNFPLALAKAEVGINDFLKARPRIENLAKKVGEIDLSGVKNALGRVMQGVNTFGDPLGSLAQAKALRGFSEMPIVAGSVNALENMPTPGLAEEATAAAAREGVGLKIPFLRETNRLPGRSKPQALTREGVWGLGISSDPETALKEIDVRLAQLEKIRRYKALVAAKRGAKIDYAGAVGKAEDILKSPDVLTGTEAIDEASKLLSEREMLVRRLGRDIPKSIRIEEAGQAASAARLQKASDLREEAQQAAEVAAAKAAGLNDMESKIAAGEQTLADLQKLPFDPEIPGDAANLAQVQKKALSLSEDLADAKKELPNLKADAKQAARTQRSLQTKAAMEEYKAQQEVLKSKEKVAQLASEPKDTFWVNKQMRTNSKTLAGKYKGARRDQAGAIILPETPVEEALRKKAYTEVNRAQGEAIDSAVGGDYLSLGAEQSNLMKLRGLQSKIAANPDVSLKGMYSGSMAPATTYAVTSSVPAAIATSNLLNAAVNPAWSRWFYNNPWLHTTGARGLLYAAPRAAEEYFRDEYTMPTFTELMQQNVK